MSGPEGKRAGCTCLGLQGLRLRLELPLPLGGGAVGQRSAAEGSLSSATFAKNTASQPGLSLQSSIDHELSYCLPVPLAGQLVDCCPSRWLGWTQLRQIRRPSRLACHATSLASEQPKHDSVKLVRTT